MYFQVNRSSCGSLLVYSNQKHPLSGLTLQENLQQQVQYKAQVHFDTQELWRVRVRLESAQGTAETVATVEATPPGYGRWDLLVYLLPFVAVGLLWSIAMIRRTRRHSEAK